MKSLTHIGIASILACCGIGAVAAKLPANTDSVTARITSVSTGESLSLRSEMGGFLTLHFLPGSAKAGEGAESSAERAFVQSIVRGAPTLAGVRQVFVLEANADEARDWVKRYGEDVPDVFVDAGGALASELQLAPGGAAPLSAPATIVFDPSGTELFRRVGSERGDWLTFGALEDRLTKATKAAAIAEYNLPKGERVAVQGYDVVSYFKENKPAKGKPAVASTYRGVKYHFSSEANRAVFAKTPDRYLPTYGGWCATAMGAKGTKVEIDPTNFKVSGGRLFLFYRDFFSDALKDWNKHEAEWEPAADTNWKKLSGENASTDVK